MRPRRAIPASATVAVSVVPPFIALSAVLYGSVLDALVFALALSLAALPGLPLGRRLFGGFEGILAGAALGYFASALAGSVLVALGLFRPAWVLALPIGLFAAARLLWPARERDREEPTATGWLAVTLLAVLGSVAIPFAKVGAAVPGGTAYRAYFSADLMTHLSVVAELQKGEFPLTNPFYAGDPFDYYWLFFTFPAAVGSWTNNQGALLSLYAASGLLFAGLLFAAVRRAGLEPGRACLASLVALFAASYDGVFALASREPWTSMNVDAFARWAFELVSLDGLHRSILYTPQHLFSYSLLVVLLLLTMRGEPRSGLSAALCGVLLGGMAGASIVTAMLAGPWLVLTLAWRLGQERWNELLRLAAVATAVSFLFLGWYLALGFFGGAGDALTLRTPRPLELPSVLLIDAGALALLALWRKGRRFSREEAQLLLLSGLALLAVLFLDLAGYEGVWMAWRAGSVLLVALALLAAPRLGGRLGLAQAFLIVPALLTAGLDLYNAQDTTNREISPGGFRWTTTVSPYEAEAFAWLRRETPPRAVVQWDSRARDLGRWAFIPALAERRMAVGFPIFLLDVRKYRVRERRHVRPIFVSGDVAEAHRLAVAAGIDYLFIGAAEIETRGELVRGLFEAPDRFEPVFANESVTILAVLPR